MVCKEDVFNWFHDLSGSSRVDFLCGLLLKCGPFELRYLGACIEDLARKDYNNLREEESNANKAAVISQLNNIFDPCTRMKLIVSLALLYSSNCNCSEIVFRTLQCQAVQIESHFTNIRDTDQVYEEFLLLLTMAVHHPAFVFQQKQILKNILDKLLLLKQAYCKSPHGDAVQDDEEGDGVPDVHRDNSSKQQPGPSTDVHRKDNTSTQSGLSSDVHHKDGTPRQSSVLIAPGLLNGETRPSAVYVKNIEVTGLQKGGDNRTEYVFKVTWSNDVVNTVNRTHGELSNFRWKLQNHFPDAGSHQSDFSLPLLPGKHSFRSANKGEFLPEIQDYARRLVVLPPHILQCEEMLNFFQYPESSTTSTIPSGIQTASATVVTSKLPDTASSHSPKVSVHKVPTNTTNRSMYTQGIPNQSLSSVSPLPSPLPSPHISPSSTQLPAAGYFRQPPGPASSSSSCVPQHVVQEEPNPVRDILKSLRLHKYFVHFEGLTVREIAKLTEEDLEKWDGITTGAKSKLMKHLNFIRQSARKLNGMADQALGQPAGVTPPQTRSHSGGGSYPMSPHQAPVQNLFTVSYSTAGSHTSESCSSDCSSTPSSPRESSDENEKDSEASESSTVSLPDARLLRSTMKEDKLSGQVYPSSSFFKSSSASSVQDLPMRSLHLAVSSSTSRKLQRSGMPTYSNVVKSRSMEPISSTETKTLPFGIALSHSHSMPSSPASDASLSQLQQQVSGGSQLPSGHDNLGRQYQPGNPSGDSYPGDVNATSPLRSSAMIFTPKQSYQVALAQADLARPPQIKSPGPVHNTASVEQNMVTTYKTCVAYVPSSTVSAATSSVVGSSPIPALSPAPAAVPQSDVAFSTAPPHNTHTVCLMNTTAAKVETIYTSAKTLAAGAQTKVTYSTASPRGGGSESPGASNLHPQSTFLVPSASPSLNTATLPPSNTFSSSEQHPATYSGNVAPNYGSGGSQGSGYHGNHPANFPPNNGNNFNGGRGPPMSYSNSGNNENMCTSSGNHSLCQSCGSPCSNNSTAFPFPVNPGFVAGHMGSALPYHNFPNFLPAMNGLISPGMPRYPPRGVPPHQPPFQNGLGDFFYTGNGNFGLIPQGSPALVPGIFHHHGNVSQPVMGPKKPMMLSCYNCGGHGHRANECKESTMEAVQCKYSLKYAPVTESEND